MQNPFVNTTAWCIPKTTMSAPVVDLLPGDIALGLTNDRLKTLLGSCVSVILTDPRRTVGVMCHIVHVGRPNADNINNTAYGDVAMATMFAQLQNIGVVPQLCEAYVYGGGNMFPQVFNQTHVGAKNADWVLDFLHRQRIAVVEQDVCGTGYRKVAWTVGPTPPIVENITANKL